MLGDEVARKLLALVGDAGAQPHEAAGAAVVVGPDERGAQEGVEDLLEQRRPAGPRLAGGEQAQALAVHDGAAAHEDGLEDLLLGAEVVMRGGDVGAAFAQDRAQRDRLVAVFREHGLGHVQYAVGGGNPLLVQDNRSMQTVGSIR